MKKILYLLFILLFVGCQHKMISTKSVYVPVVTTPHNSGAGDPLATAFEKVNAGFVDVYTTIEDTTPLVDAIIDPAVAALIEVQIQAALASYGGGSGVTGLFYYLKGRVDVTDGLPNAGDSTLTHTNFVGKKTIVFREGYKKDQNADNTETDGYWFDNASGTITFRPVLASNEQLEIWSTNTILWQALIPEGGGGEPPATPSTLLTGLMAYWDLDESSGTAFSDALGVNNGTTTAATGQPGEVGLGQKFDASTDHSIVPYSASLSVAGLDHLTISLRVKFDAVGNADGQNLFVMRTADATYWSVYLRVNADNALVFYTKNTAGTTYQAATTDAYFSTGVWYKIIAEVNGTGNPLELYINNTDAVSTTQNFSGTLLPNDYNVQIGSSSSSTDVAYTRGTLDEPGIWNRALTAGERTILNTAITHPF